MSCSIPIHDHSFFSKKFFGQLSDGKEIDLYTLRNKQGMFWVIAPLKAMSDLFKVDPPPISVQSLDGSLGELVMGN
jgi:hypothetical protein